jgi:hypothetical protein
MMKWWMMKWRMMKWLYHRRRISRFLHPRMFSLRKMAAFDVTLIPVCFCFH